jgi:hypothetical protein
MSEGNVPFPSAKHGNLPLQSLLNIVVPAQRGNLAGQGLYHGKAAGSWPRHGTIALFLHCSNIRVTVLDTPREPRWATVAR